MRVVILPDAQSVSLRRRHGVDIISLFPNPTLGWQLAVRLWYLSGVDSAVSSRPGKFREVTTFNLDEYVGIPRPRAVLLELCRSIFSSTSTSPLKIVTFRVEIPRCTGECTDFEDLIQAVGRYRSATAGH